MLSAETTWPGVESGQAGRRRPGPSSSLHWAAAPWTPAAGQPETQRTAAQRLGSEGKGNRVARSQSIHGPGQGGDGHSPQPQGPRWGQSVGKPVHVHTCVQHTQEFPQQPCS